MTRVVCVGLAVVDYAFGLPEIPVTHGKHFAERLEIVGGGPAANAAVTVVSLGGVASFVGRVGDDVIAREILNGLYTMGVDTSSVVGVAGATSPVSAVIIDRDAERMIVNHRDDRLYVRPPDEVPAAVAGADAVLVDMRWPMGAAVALGEARAAGVPGVVDFDSHRATDVTPILDRASHVIFSAAALEGLAGTADPAAGLRAVARRSEAWLAVTLGADGVLWLEGDEPRHLPAFEVDALDTLGAGDVFHGAFALAVGEGQAIERALTISAAAAAIKCTRFGGRAGIPSRRDVEAFLSERGGGSWS